MANLAGVAAVVFSQDVTLAALRGVAALSFGHTAALLSPAGVIGFEFGGSAQTLAIMNTGGQVTAVYEKWIASGTISAEDITFSGAAVWEPWASTGDSDTGGAVEFEEWTATGNISVAFTGAVVWEDWRITSGANTGRAEYEYWRATGQLTVVVDAVTHTAVMNTRWKGVTEYTNFGFNSYAKIGRDYYAAGPDGIVKLGGVGTDDGAYIDWVLRTGQLDDGKAVKKKLPEIVLGLRSNGKVTVRVHPNDLIYYDYVMPAVNTGNIHQHRVNPGKGMQSRWFSVELRSVDGCDLELASTQVNMEEVTRRIG